MHPLHLEKSLGVFLCQNMFPAHLEDRREEETKAFSLYVPVSVTTRALFLRTRLDLAIQLIESLCYVNLFRVWACLSSVSLYFSKTVGRAHAYILDSRLKLLFFCPEGLPRLWSFSIDV